MTYTPGTIYVALLTPDGKPESGEVLVIPRSSPIKDPTDGRIALPGRAGPVRLVPTEIDELDNDGEPTGRKLHPGVASIAVPPTLGMDPDYVPYDVWINLDRQKEPLIVLAVEVPAGGTVNLAEWTETTTTPGVPNVQRAAEAARDRAETAAASAEESAASAGGSAGAAAGSAGAADASELAAAQSAAGAAGARDGAVAARQGAEMAQGAAAASEQAAAGSEAAASSSAEAAAESAAAAAGDRAGADDARGAAETAQEQAESARDTAHASELAAAAAKAAAEAAQGGALEQAGISTARAAESLASSVAAAASAQTATDKAAAIPSMPVLLTNLAPNPRALGTIGGWGLAAPGSSTGNVVSYETVGGPSADCPTWNRVVLGSAPGSGLGVGMLVGTPSRIPVVAGKVYSVGLAGFTSVAPTSAGVYAYFRNAAGNVVASGSVFGSLTPVSAAGWFVRSLLSMVAPAGAVAVDARVVFTSTGGMGAGTIVGSSQAIAVEGAALPSDWFAELTPGARALVGGGSELVIPRGSDLTDYARRAVRYYEGTGSPENVVAATPGAEYVDLAGTNGAWVWRKRTGTGATGWVCVDGDTGWRDVTAGLSGIVAGSLHLRRVNERCYVKANNLTLEADSAAAVNLVAFTTGFLPSEIRTARLIKQNNAGVIYNAYVGSAVLVVTSSWSIAVYRGGWLAADPLRGQIDYITNQAWPTALPGTAV